MQFATVLLLSLMMAITLPLRAETSLRGLVGDKPEGVPASSENPPEIKVSGAPLVVVPDKLPPNANLNRKTFLRFKIFQTKWKNQEANAYLVIRFSCDPLRYSAWLSNEKDGVSGNITQIKFDDQAVLNIAAFRQTPKVLVLEDAWDEAEKSFSDRIRVTKNINITYSTAQKKIENAVFAVSSISNQLADAEKTCFQD